MNEQKLHWKLKKLYSCNSNWGSLHFIAHVYRMISLFPDIIGQGHRDLEIIPEICFFTVEMKL